MKGLLIATGILGLAAAGCSNGSGNLSTTPSPSAVISSAATTANQAVCAAQQQATQIVSQVRSEAVSSQSDLVAKLGELQSSLETQASNLDAAGQTTVATTLRSLADAVGQLKTAVQDQSTQDIVEAAAKVGSMIAALPACASGPAPAATSSG
jgi:chemotaxis protein histidine kinase CheA